MRAEDQTSASPFDVQIMMRRLFLATLGGIALVGDAVGAKVNRYMSRGAYIEWETTETTREILGQFRLQSHAANPHQSAHNDMQWLVDLIGLPSHYDVQILHEQINLLNTWIDALSAQRQE